MVSDRLEGVEYSGIRKMFDMASKDSIHLGLGEPDFQPPHPAIQALLRAVNAGLNKYGPTVGLPELREQIAARLAQFKRDITKEEIIVTFLAVLEMVKVSLVKLAQHVQTGIIRLFYAG